MSNTATLGLEIRATGVREAASDLATLTTSAVKAEAATEAVGRASEVAGQRMSGIGRAAERNAAVLDKAQREAIALDRQMRTAGGGMNNAAAAAMKMEIAVDAVSDSLTRARDASGRFVKAANDAAVQTRVLGGAAGGASAGLGGLGEGLGSAGIRAQAANRNFKLTGDQLRNMSFQINDAATMALSGASAFQILATQGGHVFQVLQEGPNGVKGSMMAIGQSILRLITPMNLVIAGFTAAAGAAVYFAYKATQKIKPMNEAMEAHAASIKAVAAAYDIAVEANARYTSKTQTSFAAQKSEADLRLSARSSLFENGFAGGGDFVRMGRTDDGGRTHKVYEEYAAFSAPLLKLAAGMRAGTEDARAFVDEIGRIALADPGNRELRAKADAIIALARPAADAAAQLEVLADSMLRVQQARISEATDSFKEFLPNTKTTAELINERYQARIAAIGALPASQRGTSEGMRIAAANDLKKALEELDRVEANRRAGYELDIKTIGARTAQEKAAIAAERERLALADVNIAASEKERRIEEARTLSLTESGAAMTEATRQRIASGQTNVEQMEFELGLVGKSTAETARLRAEYDMLTAAKEAARAAGTVVDPAEEQTIKDQAARIGELTAAMQKLNFERDIAFRLDQAGRTSSEQRIAQEVRQYGEDISTANGQAMAAQLRYADSVEKTRDQLQEMREVGKDAFLDIVDAIGSGEDAGKSFISVLANVGKHLASMGAQKLFDGLFGGSGAANDNSAGGFSGIFGAISQAAKPKTATEIFGGGQTFAAPASAPVQRGGALAAIDSITSGQSAKLASTVTKQVSSNLLSSMLGAGKSQAHISGLNTQFASALTNMLDAAPEAVRSAVTINSGFRSVARQAELFEGALAKYGSVAAARKWVAPPGKSNHNAGMAADLGYGSASARQWMHENAGKYGLAFPLGNENWHIELASARGGKSTSAVTAEAVQQGMKSYGRDVSSGAAPSLLGNLGGGFSSPWQAVSGTGPTAGVDPWAGMRTATTGGATSGLGGIGGGLQNLMKSPIVGLGMNALTAGAAGYQSGSALGGGLTGALSGFMSGGPVGALVGGISGLVGGIFGGKAKRKAAHQAAADEWAAMGPEWSAYQDELKTGKGPTSNLRENFKTLGDKLVNFVAVGSKAWKMGSNNSSALYSSVTTDLGAYYAKMVEGFASKFDATIGSLSAGRGVGTEFDTVRENIAGIADELLTFIDDAKYAFIELPQGAGADGEPARVAEAQIAAQKQLLSAFSASVTPMTEVETAMQKFKAAAETLQPYLVEMGMAADDAAVAIDEKLNAAVKGLGASITQGMQDEINALDGKGYLADFRALMDSQTSMLADASLVNVDTSLVDTFFAKKAQSLVDGSEIAGSAFDDLIRLFPQLTGKVTAFGGAISDLIDRMAGYNDRYFNATTDTSTLAGASAAFNRNAAAEQRAEMASGGGAMLQLQAAQAAERVAMVQGLLTAARQEEVSQLEETISRLQSLSDEWADLRKSLLLDDSLTPLSQQDQFLEAQKQFRELSAKAAGGDEDAQAKLAGISQSYLEEAKAYYASSEAYYSAFNEVQGVLANSETLAQQQLSAAKSQLSIAQAQLDAMRGVKDGVGALHAALVEAMAALAKFAPAMGGSVAPGTSVPETTGGLPGGSYSVGTKSSAYLASNADVAAAIAAGETFGLPAGMRPEVYASAHYGLFGQTEGRGWADGGYTGHGARHEIAGSVHKGEVVWSQPDIARWGGVSNVEGMRVSAMPRVPAISMPRVAANAEGRGMAEMAAELKRVNAKLDRLTAVTAEGNMLNAKATREGNSAQQTLAQVAKRAAA